MPRWCPSQLFQRKQLEGDRLSKHYLNDRTGKLVKIICELNGFEPGGTLYRESIGLDGAHVIAGKNRDLLYTAWYVGIEEGDSFRGVSCTTLLNSLGSLSWEMQERRSGIQWECPRQLLFSGRTRRCPDGSPAKVSQFSPRSWPID